jgi:threonine/homoserine/homoserine lactone efflux protein
MKILPCLIVLSPLNIILFALSAYVMGFLAAIPIGATQIEIAKRLLNGLTFSAIMIVAGAVISDFTYGVIALFGIAPFLQTLGIIAIFSLANSIILIVLGILTIRQSRKKADDNQDSIEILPKKRVAFVTGFLLAVANPVIIYWWLLGSRFLGGIFHIEKYTIFNIFLLLIAGTLGIGSYPMTIFIVVHKTKRFFSGKTIMKTTFIFGLALFGLAAYFLYEALSYFLAPAPAP